MPKSNAKTNNILRNRLWPPVIGFGCFSLDVDIEIGLVLVFARSVLCAGREVRTEVCGSSERSGAFRISHGHDSRRD